MLKLINIFKTKFSINEYKILYIIFKKSIYNYFIF